MERQDHSGDDRKRPLTDAGKRKTKQALEGLLKLLDSVPLLISSSAVRARQTAEIAHQLLARTGRSAELHLLDSLQPGASALRYLEAALFPPAESNCLMIFGHEPEISETCALLTQIRVIGNHYSTLWSDPARKEEVFAELEHWIHTDEGEGILEEGSLSFQIKKASVVQFGMDANGACLMALLPPSVLRSL